MVACGITQQNNHVFICGMTRSGKTYFATKALANVPRGVLFFNLQGAAVPAKFVERSASATDYSTILDALKGGEKINLTFPAAWSTAEIMAVISYLSKSLLKAGFTEQRPIYIVYDECQALTPEAVKAVRLTATRGLYLGCRCVFITQRPALADLTFYTQASEHYIFKLGAGERGYFRNKGIDFDTCLQLWEKNGLHSYVFYDGFTLEGRPAIK